MAFQTIINMADNTAVLADDTGVRWTGTVSDLMSGNLPDDVASHYYA